MKTSKYSKISNFKKIQNFHKISKNFKYFSFHKISKFQYLNNNIEKRSKNLGLFTLYSTCLLLSNSTNKSFSSVFLQYKDEYI